MVTSGDRFYTTVYANRDHDDLKITFEGGNLSDVVSFGEFWHFISDLSFLLLLKSV